MRHAKHLPGLTLLLLAGCSTAPYKTPPLPPLPQPGDIATIPEPVPKAEPRSARGNPKFYTVLGRRYFVLETAEGYLERGVASWYGPGFHASTTSNGDDVRAAGIVSPSPS